MKIDKVINCLLRFPEDSELIACDYSPGYQVRIDKKDLNFNAKYFIDVDVNCSDEYLERILK